MEIFKKFDFFPKLSEHVEVKKTAQGGAIFSFFLAIIVSLSLYELFQFTIGDPVVHPFIDKQVIDEKVRVNLNISVYEIPCEALSIDFQDITGSHFEDIQNSIYKLDLSPQGYVIDAIKFREAVKFENKNFYPSYPFWEKLTGGSKETSCYGAELYEGQECKTCDDVKRAYMQRRWPAPPVEMIYQCNGGKRVQPRQAIGNKPRQLTEEPLISNMTERTSLLESLLKNEHIPTFSLKNSLFVVNGLEKDYVFSMDIMRSKCQNPEEAILEFSYVDFKTGETKVLKTKPLFFKGTQCKSFFPFKIDSVNDKELVLQSFLLEGETLHIKIQNDELFNVKVFNANPEIKEKPSAALFKRGFSTETPTNIKGRMLHAEFYGFDDLRPTFISPQEVEYFKKKVSLNTGCQIVGTMFVKKVPGNFHISTHHKGLALRNVDKILTAQHKIHLLEFTKPDSQITLGKYVKTSNFLDGTHLKPAKGNDVQYYMKIVGSTYKSLLWGEQKFYEFVAHADLVPKYENVILLEFKYEFDPVSMRYSSGRESFAQFLISLLAIVGGLFAMSAFIDRITNRDKS